MTPKLYQIIPGGDLTSDQFQLVKEFFQEQTNLWIYSKSWYFTDCGGFFLEVYR